MASALDFPLSQLTVTMMREVFHAVADSAMEQVEACSDVVAAASLTEDLYVAQIVGGSPDDQLLKAKSYVTAVVLPTIGVASEPLSDPVLFTAAGKEALLVLFSGVTVDEAAPGAPPDPVLIEDVITASGDASLPLSISLDHLVSFSREKLVGDARRSHRKLRLAVKTGLPQVSVTGGQICTKVTMATVEVQSAQAGSSTVSAAAVLQTAKTPGGNVDLTVSKEAAAAAPASKGLVVRVVNERSAAFSRAQELVGSVKIDFRVGSFPPVVLPE